MHDTVRPEILEKGEFPRCVKCIHYIPHDDTLSLDIKPCCFYGPGPLFKEEIDHCGQGEWMMLKEAAFEIDRYPITVPFGKIFSSLYEVEWNSKEK